VKKRKRLWVRPPRLKPAESGGVVERGEPKDLNAVVEKSIGLKFLNGAARLCSVNFNLVS